ncbi:hypothetical protein [uncultured Microbacterium sp.]|uniref:hypothetical protein n=1 Tax=uncultured Microbacterium sp. TaxID=191216 RepID=UPI0025CF3C67|nr:hypothetical protein [uncultured Microbacterium sp.]
MSWADGFFFPHQVTIQEVRTGGMGTALGASRSAAAEVIDEQTLVRGADGAEVVSSTRVTVALDPPIPLGSMVTVWPDVPTAKRTAVVLQVARVENPPPLGSHQVLYLK